MADPSILSAGVESAGAIDSAAAVLAGFYRCPAVPGSMTVADGLCPAPGYFRLGKHTIGYGRSTLGSAAHPEGHALPDVSQAIHTHGGIVQLPFDPVEVLDNLRRERYATGGSNGNRGLLSSRPLREAYYSVRPMLPIPVRKHAQQVFLRNWRSLRFPAWPVDTTVEEILERLLVLYMSARNLDTLPFIWFWPDGASSCAVLTHDVETSAGAAFAPRLMDLDDAFGFKSSFQIIPEKQYPVSPALLNLIRSRGFEVNVQDLRHDGNLFDHREKFRHRARAINRYVREFAAAGFRSGRLYRNTEWFEELQIEYDMSVPNVGHLEAQRGGCCTVFPYFIGDILELPLTTSQDYTLFHVLNDMSIELWKKQIARINARHGLATFIVHPDYIRYEKPLAVYKQLLRYLSDARKERKVWTAMPGDVNRWWRARSRMTLDCRCGKWQIRGEGKERARIAYARLVNGRLRYTAECNAGSKGF